MKVYYSILLAFGITLISCQKNDNSEELINPIQSKSHMRFEEVDTTNPEDPFEDLELENNMEWVSYLLAETLLYSIESQNHFMDIYENSISYGDGIKLELLFQESQDDQEYDAFLTTFEETFWCFEEQGLNCGTNGGRPQGRVNPGGHSPQICPDAYCEFLNYILDRHCIYIYIPNGIDFRILNLQISSTAHPLNQNLYNDLYIHNSGFVEFGIVSNNGVDVLGATPSINHYELDEVQNILVTRPYRNETNCVYDYLIDDFTLFLSN